MKILVVDDEPAARAKLRRLLAAHADVQDVLEAADAPSALALIAREGPFDIAVLDIEMPGGSGLQLAERLREVSPRTRCVFSTAYAEHALRAFEIGAIDYLLKPFHAERLAQTLTRLRELLALPPPMADLAAPAGFWWVETRQGRLRIALAEVQWLSSADNYVCFHLPPLSHLQRGSLGALLERPGLAGLFLRVHRCHAINPTQVMEQGSAPGGEAWLRMRSGERLPVSRGYRAVLDCLKH